MTDGKVLATYLIETPHPLEHAAAVIAAGDLRLASDFPLDNSLDRLVLVHDTGNWYELSRSDNGA